MLANLDNLARFSNKSWSSRFNTALYFEQIAFFCELINNKNGKKQLSNTCQLLMLTYPSLLVLNEVVIQSNRPFTRFICQIMLVF